MLAVTEDYKGQQRRNMINWLRGMGCTIPLHNKSMRHLEIIFRSMVVNGKTAD